VLFPFVSAKLYDWFGVRVLIPDVERFYRQFLGQLIETRRRTANVGEAKDDVKKNIRFFSFLYSLEWIYCK